MKIDSVLYYYQLTTHFFLVQLGNNHYSYWYSYSLIALAFARAISGHTHTSRSTDYSLIVTRKCVINYTNYTTLYYNYTLRIIILYKE